MTIRPKTRKTFAVSVELGQSSDGSAIAVVELVDRPGSPTAPPAGQPDFHLRYLKRFPPAPDHTATAHGLLDLLDFIERTESKEKNPFGGEDLDVDLTVLLVIDQTVAHKPVVDMILKMVNRSEARRVVISGSHSQGYSDGYYRVPKPELISLMQAGLELKQLKFAKDLPETNLLAEELIQYQDRPTNPMPPEHSWREHPSDDLVLAVALACWTLQQGPGFSYEYI